MSAGGRGEASGPPKRGNEPPHTDEMANFVGMLMDLVGVFNKDDTKPPLSLDDPRMT